MRGEICTKSVSELRMKKFFVPKFQRGYRWTERQVVDLLDDLKKFMTAAGPETNMSMFYCLQPLVVASRFDEAEKLEKIKKAGSVAEVERLLRDSWMVVDGQQRLTTIHLLLSYLGCGPAYEITYETRDKTAKNGLTSSRFLNEVSDWCGRPEAESNADFFHLSRAYGCIDRWFREHGGDVDREAFLDFVLERIKFIWYEPEDEDLIAVFTRLNIGKIPLTNAELVKALLLNRSNFEGDCGLSQRDLAIKWDEVERELENDSFWYFLQETGTERPTRIDFLLDLLLEGVMNPLGVSADVLTALGNDKWRTFRYFEAFFSENESSAGQKVALAWNAIYDRYRTLRDWYEDNELYHYIGYLRTIGFPVKTGGDDAVDSSLPGLLTAAARVRTKEAFLVSVKRLVAASLSRIREAARKQKCASILDVQYEDDGMPPKTLCRPLLLLHNIEASVRGRVANRFPFDLYKNEQWDVEHIDSNTENELDEFDAQTEWLLNCWCGVGEGLKRRIRAFCEKSPDERDFLALRTAVEAGDGDMFDANQILSDTEKNKVWNFALLDCHTNRGYGNSIFPAKRRCIIAKDQGKRIGHPVIGADGKLVCGDTESGSASSPFIPPCTRQAFLKYHTLTATGSLRWCRGDAEAYRKNIEELLGGFDLSSH